MTLGLYVHIPFCRHKCLYCDFPSYAGLERYCQGYVEALCRNSTVPLVKVAWRFSIW